MSGRQPSHKGCSATLAGYCVGICVLMFGLLLCSAATPVYSAPSASEQSVSEQFQGRIKAVAQSLGNDPRLKKLSLQQRENLVEFITGNMLFVMLHELAHATVDEFRLSVLGREEDAADDFAVLRLLAVGTDFSHRILVEATKGWFFSDRRDRQDGEKLVFFDEHGLDQQRAYQIVCLMVGSNPVEFKDLADETKLPEDRRQSCQKDYGKILMSWDTALKPHRRSAEQPKTNIEVTYGEGKGKFDAYAKGFRDLRLLEAVAERAEDNLAWPAPFALEMQSCGFINARWVVTTRKLTLCYELAADFAELYRDFDLPRTAKNKRKSK
jgi:Putative metallopeptidase